MKNKVLIFRIVFTIVLAVFLYYFLLPPLNLSSPLFWFYAFIIFVSYLVSGVAKIVELKDIITNKKKSKQPTVSFGIGFLVLIGGFVLILFINFLQSPFFNFNAYYNRINISYDHEFNDDVS